MLAVKFSSPSDSYDPYAKAIEQFMGREFPQLSSGKVEDVMEAVVEEFLTTKQYRVGPRPNPESLVRIRSVVREFVNVGGPIPILVPSAAIKVPVGNDLDLAELSALRMLCALQQRIKQHYDPGVDITIRMEDLTEAVISEDVPDITAWTSDYISAFTGLVNVLGYEEFIHIAPESTLADRAKFITAARKYAETFLKYIEGDSSVGDILHVLGWRDGVSPEMIQFLWDRYKKLYPGRESEYNQMMAEYLGTILARRSMQATGLLGPKLEISFANPLPDAPMVSTRIQYRTVPRAQTTKVAPYWNVKGYLRISEEGKPKIALGGWDGDYTPGILTISNGGDSVNVQADYVLD